MKPIGGFFEMLLPQHSFNFHSEAVSLTNGRACIRTFLKNQKVLNCYLPNYTCDAVYHPFELENIQFTLYSIDEYLSPIGLPTLKEGEYFYYINYFGVKSDVVLKLQEHYGDKLIIDNTHSFFTKRIKNNWSFTSARKYFGVPDGAFLYAPFMIEDSYERFNEISILHNFERLKGNQEKAFKAFLLYEGSLNAEIKRISLYSEKMLSLVDTGFVRQKRINNFNILQDVFYKYNTLQFRLSKDEVPFCYPFLPQSRLDKTLLYRDKIFVPSLWTDPQSRPGSSTKFELHLSESLLPLPCDERYDKEDMEKLITNVKSLFNKN